MRGATILFLTLVFLTMPAWGRTCASLLGGETSHVTRADVVRVYERLLGSAGAGILSERDLAQLLQGDLFLLDPAGRAEAIPVADGLAQLGAFVKERFTGDEALNGELVSLVKKHLEGTESTGTEQNRAQNRHALASPVVTELGGDMGPVSQVTLHPDGKHLAEIGYHRPIAIREIPSGKVVGEIPTRLESIRFLFSAAGEAVIADPRQKLEVWAPPKPGELSWIRKSNVIVSTEEVDFDMLAQAVDGGKTLLFATRHSLRTFPLVSGLLPEVRRYRTSLIYLRPSPAGNLILLSNSISNTMEREFVLWTVPALTSAHGQPQARLPVDYAVWSGDGTRIVALQKTKRGDSDLVVFHYATVAELSRVAAPSESANVTCNRDGSLAVIGKRTVLHLMNTASGAKVADIEKGYGFTRQGFAGAHGLWVAFENKLVVVDTRSGEELLQTPLDAPNDLGSGRDRVLWNAPHQRLITWGRDNVIHIHNLGAWIDRVAP